MYVRTYVCMFVGISLCLSGFPRCCVGCLEYFVEVWGRICIRSTTTAPTIDLLLLILLLLAQCRVVLPACLPRVCDWCGVMEWCGCDGEQKYDFVINKLVSAVDAEFALLNNKIRMLELELQSQGQGQGGQGQGVAGAYHS